jgi:hypothetical protein
MHDFETHLYTNNKRLRVDVLYQRLFCVFINYIGLSTQEEELFNIFKAYHHASYTLLPCSIHSLRLTLTLMCRWTKWICKALCHVLKRSWVDSSEPVSPASTLSPQCHQEKD